MNKSRKIQVTLALHRKTELPEDDEMQQLLDTTAPLDVEELEDRHGADPEAIAQVRVFAEKAGLSIAQEEAGHGLVVLEGKIGDMCEAFDVEMESREDILGKYRTHRGSINLPKELAEHVDGVTGLDDRRNLSMPPRDSLLQYRFAPAPQHLRPYTPAEIAEYYNFPRELDGSGQTIGIISLGGSFKQSDMEQYFHQQGLPMPEIELQRITPPGSRRGKSQTDPDLLESHNIEATLDLQLAGAFAPGAKLVLYSVDSHTHYLPAIKAALHDRRRPSVISISYGMPERLCLPRNLQLTHEAFAEAALLGTTVCAASGDGGSATLFYGSFSNPPPTTHVLFPACSPYVLACSATSLPRGDIETVWNDLGQCRAASGGGVSVYFPRPKYQEQCNIPANPTQGAPQTGRGVPDVAASADVRWGYEIIYNGQTRPAGATSASAPIWAALIARLNQGLGRNLGFAHPHFYRLADSGGFVSINHGFNGSYHAAEGWDACTGLGRPDGQLLYEALQATLGAANSQRDNPPHALVQSAYMAAANARWAANAAAQAAQNRWR